MAFEKQVQQLVHNLEEGSWRKWVYLGVIISVFCGLCTLFIFDPGTVGFFKGLSHAKGMEQAVIARELARGHGFSSLVIRPIEYEQMKENKGIPGADYVLPSAVPDTFYAPLWPVTLAPAMWLMRKHWEMGPKDFHYVMDRVVTGVATLCFALSVVVAFFTVRRLFDYRIGVMVAGMLILADVFWRYAQTGLPQMLMALLFNCACYALVRAVENAIDGRPPLGWIIVMSVFFGLLALTHSMTIWIFAGALLFCIFYFKPRGVVAGMMIAILLVMYVPWLYRLYHISGNASGTAGYTLVSGMRGSESQIMRDTKLGYGGFNPLNFRNKVQTGVNLQFSELIPFLGNCLIAPVFFIALLHLFKNPTTSHVRWAVLCMWLFAVLGMAVFGLTDDDPTSGLQANNLHILFIPLFLAYGLAFVMVLWSRLEINVRLVEYAFITLLFVVSAIPMINTLVGGRKGIFQWPPYCPIGIHQLNDFSSDREIIMSDMPWAVAWYADRKSLWLPATVDQFIDYHDYRYLGAPIIGMFLTPVTGNQPFISGLNFGEYKEWKEFVMRQVSSKDFPFHAAVPLPLENQCIFYADHDRWTTRND